LSFEKADEEAFPCMALAKEAGRKGKSYPVVLNAANEVLVHRFLQGEILFVDIPNQLMRILERHETFSTGWVGGDIRVGPRSEESNMTIVYAVIIFAILIFFHELGHFATAKIFGVKVNEFAIGMGPALFKKQRGETLYSVRGIPIGGYCSGGQDEILLMKILS
jgi:hypothetical protein